MSNYVLRKGDEGQEVIVNNSMVEEIKVHEGTHYLLLENYVYGLTHQGD